MLKTRKRESMKLLTLTPLLAVSAACGSTAQRQPASNKPPASPVGSIEPAPSSALVDMAQLWADATEEQKSDLCTWYHIDRDNFYNSIWESGEFSREDGEAFMVVVESAC